ncbi:MAG TPA: ABC transporter permease [Saprospiraceae bacterium]|nr:ABC transporter permease [Saprospiraceae bacterium]
MIQNFIKIAFRDLWKQKGLTAINILGLSIGLTCFALFLLYTVNELNYDRFHADSDRIYRVYRWTEVMRGETTEGDPYLPIPLAPALKADFPDVEKAVRLRAWGEDFVRTNGMVTQMDIYFADPDFFEVLTFPIKYGNAATALTELNSLVLTEKTALKLFGESNPIGRVLEIKNGDQFIPFTVSAVAADLPSNSTITFQILGNFECLKNNPRMAKRWTNWNHSAYFTFVKLRPGSNLANDDARLLQFRRKYYPEEEQELRKEGFWTASGAPITYRFQPIRQMHTQTMVAGGDVPPVEPRSIWTLLGIATGVLGIACVNFTTLAIGRSAGRAREVGVRKVMGSDRRLLVGQFLTESMLLATISGIFGLLLARVLLPAFNELADRELTFSLQQFPELAWLIGGIILITGLISGIYPAMVLSGFRPVEILKSKVRLGGSNLFTKSLVAGQFVLSVGLMVCTFVMLKQLSFMRSKNPGFDRENVVMVDATGADTKRIYPLFKTAAQSIPGVQGVAGSELGLGAGQGWSRSGWKDNGVQREVFEYFVDKDFIPVLKMELLAGRNFEAGNTLDTVNSVIVNESLVRSFGWTNQSALGQQLAGYYEDPKKALPVVIGVVKDFNYLSLKQDIQPQMFHQFSDYQPFRFFVRIGPGDPFKTLDALKSAWVGAEPVLPFRYHFLDERLDQFYAAEKRLGNIISWAGGIAIFLACLGLLGLAALAVVNRTREIGIRKVLGASVAGITALLAKDFLKLVLLAILLASPMAYYFMDKWLADYAFRIKMQWWMFAGAGVLAILVAAFTVSLQSIKAALENPVKSLRSE